MFGAVDEPSGIDHSGGRSEQLAAIGLKNVFEWKKGYGGHGLGGSSGFRWQRGGIKNPIKGIARRLKNCAHGGGHGPTDSMRRIRAGFPTTTARGGTFLVTTAPAPIV